MLMSSNCSTSSMSSFCLLILTTSAAWPALRRANLNLRSAALSSWGISTVLDCACDGGFKHIQQRAAHGYFSEIHFWADNGGTDHLVDKIEWQELCGYWQGESSC